MYSFGCSAWGSRFQHSFNKSWLRWWIIYKRSIQKRREWRTIGCRWYAAWLILFRFLGRRRRWRWWLWLWDHQQPVELSSLVSRVRKGVTMYYQYLTTLKRRHRTRIIETGARLKDFGTAVIAVWSMPTVIQLAYEIQNLYINHARSSIPYTYLRNVQKIRRVHRSFVRVSCLYCWTTSLHACSVCCRCDSKFPYCCSPVCGIRKMLMVPLGCIIFGLHAY